MLMVEGGAALSAMYSTTERLVRSGQAFSSRRGLVTVLEPQRAEEAPRPESPAPLRFTLSPAAGGAGGADALPGGEVDLRPLADGSSLVRARAQSLPDSRDPDVRPTLWLLHDLRVPVDLAAADLARLPGSGAGTGNRPGQVFTLDGGPPESGDGSRVVSVAVSAGELARQADGSWALEGRLDQRTNRAAHPLVLLGPSVLPSINASLPSGTVAGLLTDLLLRKATLHPELPMPDRYPERLAAVGARWLVQGPKSFLSPEQFDRALVTLEGPVRHTPNLVPNPKPVLRGSKGSSS